MSTSPIDSDGVVEFIGPPKPTSFVRISRPSSPDAAETREVFTVGFGNSDKEELQALHEEALIDLGHLLSTDFQGTNSTVFVQFAYLGSIDGKGSPYMLYHIDDGERRYHLGPDENNRVCTDAACYGFSREDEGSQDEQGNTVAPLTQLSLKDDYMLDDDLMCNTEETMIKPVAMKWLKLVKDMNKDPTGREQVVVVHGKKPLDKWEEEQYELLRDDDTYDASVNNFQKQSATNRSTARYRDEKAGANIQVASRDSGQRRSHGPTMYRDEPSYFARTDTSTQPVKQQVQLGTLLVRTLPDGSSDFSIHAPTSSATVRHHDHDESNPFCWGYPSAESCREEALSFSDVDGIKPLNARCKPKGHNFEATFREALCDAYEIERASVNDARRKGKSTASFEELTFANSQAGEVASKFPAVFAWCEQLLSERQAAEASRGAEKQRGEDVSVPKPQKAQLASTVSKGFADSVQSSRDDQHRRRGEKGLIRYCGQQRDDISSWSGSHMADPKVHGLW